MVAGLPRYGSGRGDRWLSVVVVTSSSSTGGEERCRRIRPTTAATSSGVDRQAAKADVVWFRFPLKSSDNRRPSSCRRHHMKKTRGRQRRRQTVAPSHRHGRRRCYCSRKWWPAVVLGWPDGCTVVCRAGVKEGWWWFGKVKNIQNPLVQLDISTPIPISFTISNALACCSAAIGQAAIGFPNQMLSSVEFHPQCETKPPTPGWLSMAAWGAHPMTFPTPCVLSKNPSGRTSLGLVYSPGIREPFSGIRLSTHRNLCPLRSKAIAISFTCSSGKVHRRGLRVVGEGLDCVGFELEKGVHNNTLSRANPFGHGEEHCEPVFIQQRRGEQLGRIRVDEAQHGGPGGVEHVGRNSKLVRHVNHGRGEHVDHEPAQADATDSFFNAFSDSRFERVYGEHRGGRNVGGVDGYRLVQWECHELQPPFRGLGLDERGDFEVERWCQDEEGDGDMVVSVNKELCDFNCG
nr:Os06g0343500 protein [Ipomoea batatas]